MAETYRFVDNDGVELVNFLGGDYYYNSPLSLPGVRPGVLTVERAISLLRQGTLASHRSLIQDLENALSDASDYHNNELLPGWVWWEWITEGESNKRVLVYPGGWVEHPAGDHGDAFMRGEHSQPVIHFPTHPYGESPTADQVTSSDVDLIGSKTTIAAGGTADGRVDEIIITESGTLTNVIQKLWLGFRETGQGHSAFQPVWDVVDGTLGANTASVVDSDSINGNAAETTYDTGQQGIVEEIVARVEVSDISAINQSHFIGRYLVLGRFHGPASKQFSVRLSVGHGGLPMFSLPKRYIETQGEGQPTHNIYQLEPLGIVDIPYMGAKQAWTDAQIGTTSLIVQAELLNGTGADKLRTDTLTLIPATNILTIDNGQLSTSQDIHIKMLPNDRIRAWSHIISSGLVYDRAKAAPVNFTVPRKGGILVVAGTNNQESNVGDAISLTIDTVKRWISYR